MDSSFRSGPDASVFALLHAFLASSGSGLPAQVPSAPTVQLVTAGTLPRFSDRLGGGPMARLLSTTLRSLAQVIFINNPISGLLLLLALGLQSTATAVMAALAIAAANGTARLIDADPAVTRQGIHGFNGALVGAAVAAFAALETPVARLLWAAVAVLGAALSTLLIEGPGRWFVRRWGLPPLTLPFCLATWSLLGLAHSLPGVLLPLATSPPAPALDPSLWFWPLGALRGFAQVFLCSSVFTAASVLAAVALASPLAALLGLAGGLVSGVVSLAIGMDPHSLALGLGSYNGVLCAIAVAGIFHAPVPASTVIALLSAAASALLAPPLSALLAVVRLPLLTAPFVLSSLVTLLLVRRSLPSLLPVALHALVTPEEHRLRYLAARELLSDFRQRLQHRGAGGCGSIQRQLADAGDRLRLEQLFAALDRDGDGQLSLEELAAGLDRHDPVPGGLQRGEAIPAALLTSLDLRGDGQVDPADFVELMLRLRSLDQGRQRLQTYLLPLDADSDDHLDPEEFDRLLVSVGQPGLLVGERQFLFGPDARSLSWGSLLERMLLT